MAKRRSSGLGSPISAHKVGYRDELRVAVRLLKNIDRLIANGACAPAMMNLLDARDAIGRAHAEFSSTGTKRYSKKGGSRLSALRRVAARLEQRLKKECLCD